MRVLDGRHHLDAGPERDRHDDGVHRRRLPGDRRRRLTRPPIASAMPIHDEITEAVLAREEVARYLQAGGDVEGAVRRASASRPTSTRCGRRSGTRSTRRSEHPLYPILRKVDRRAEGVDHIREGDRGRPRRLHLEPQEPSRLRARAAGPRGLRDPAAGDRRGHQPVRRAARRHQPPRHRRHPDPPQHQGPRLPRDAEGLRRRSAASPRRVLLHRGRPQLHRRVQGAEDRPGARDAAGRDRRPPDHPRRHRLRPRARGPHACAAGRQEGSAPLQPRAGRDGRLSGRLPDASRSPASARRSRSRATITTRAATSSSSRTWSARASAPLHKVVPTAIVAAAMRPSSPPHELRARIAELVDSLRARGANLDAHRPAGDHGARRGARSSIATRWPSTTAATASAIARCCATTRDRSDTCSTRRGPPKRRWPSPRPC